MPFLADYHTHSKFSSDGKDSIADMLTAAQDTGLNELCVTDHCDMWAAFDCAAERYQAFLDARERNMTDVKLLLGIELGEAIHNKPLAEARIAEQPYDFIIGSYHALRDQQDFYSVRYTSEEQCHKLLSQYFIELLELAEWGNFDVLGHIDYPLRYMQRDGFNLSLLPRYESEMRELFVLLAQKNLGIELNGKGDHQAFADVLALYRQCGGDILTIGSDAHNTSAVGRGIAEAVEVCRKAGFTHLTAFEQRRPRYEKI